MKKIAALLLVFIMLLDLCSCNSTKLTIENLLGTWEAESTMADYSAMSGEEVEGTEGIPKKYIDKIYNLKYSWRIVFNKDGTYEAKISKTTVENSYNDQLDVMMEYYKDEGLLLMYQALGATVKNNEELETYLIANGSSTKEVIDATRVQFKTLIEKSMEKANEELGELGKDGYYTKKGEFTVAEDSITLISKDDDDEEKIHYCKLIDKDTLSVNRIYYDFEEFDVDINYKRIK